MKAERHVDHDLIMGRPGKAILYFSIPIILGNLLQQLYNMVDAVVASNFVGENALAAIGASYAITNVYLAFALGGCIGSAVIISQFFGAQEHGKVRLSISTMLINFLGLGCVLGAIGLLTSGRFLEALNTPDAVMADAKIYLDIYFWGLPFLFLYNACTAILNSLGNSKTPLRLLMFSSFLNIVLDLVFVVAFENGVAGVAIATLIAQSLAAVLSLFVVWRKTRELAPAEKLYSADITLRMLKVAVPTTIQQCIVFVGMLLVQSVVNGFGAPTLAGFSAAIRFESICVVPLIAVGNALSTFTAQNVGAGHMDRVKQGFAAATRISLGISAIILVIFLVAGKTMVMAFLGTSEPSGTAFEVGMACTMFEAYFYILIGLKSNVDGVLRGAGDVVAFTFANLVNLGIRVLFAIFFAPILGVRAVWLAVPMGWMANFIISYCWYLTGRWTKKRLIA